MKKILLSILSIFAVAMATYAADYQQANEEAEQDYFNITGLSVATGEVAIIPHPIYLTVDAPAFAWGDYSCDGSKMSLTDQDGTNYISSSVPVDDDYEQPTQYERIRILLIDNQAISDDGVYTLTIQEGAFTLAGKINKEYTATWYLGDTGVASVAANAENGYVVYDLNGCVVMQTRNAADLQRLEKGVYIVNGKKVVLTK